MKEINKIIFTISLMLTFCVLLSCNTEKFGSFNNRASHYEVKENPIQDSSSDSHTALNPGNNSPETIEASIETPAEISEPPKQLVVIPTKTPQIASSNRPAGTLKPEVKDQIIQEPVKKLTKEEKREIKRILKSSQPARTNVVGKVLLVIFAIILPPLAVALVDGLTGPFWLDLLLTILFYLPGLIYALWRVLRTGS